MLYVARLLYTHSGDTLDCQVVEVADGVVTAVFPFDSERAAMQFVETIVLKPSSLSCENTDDDTSFAVSDNGLLSAFSLSSDGDLTRLE
jgi:hypothetical protein